MQSDAASATTEGAAALRHLVHRTQGRGRWAVSDVTCAYCALRQEVHHDRWGSRGFHVCERSTCARRIPWPGSVTRNFRDAMLAYSWALNDAGFRDLSDDLLFLYKAPRRAEPVLRAQGEKLAADPSPSGSKLSLVALEVADLARRIGALPERQRLFDLGTVEVARAVKRNAGALWSVPRWLPA